MTLTNNSTCSRQPFNLNALAAEVFQYLACTCRLTNWCSRICLIIGASSDVFRFVELSLSTYVVVNKYLWLSVCSMQMVQVLGKRSRPVPILFTDDMLTALEMLMQCRTGIVPEDNKFVFANPDTNGYLDFYKSLHKVAEDAGMKKPKLLTATRLRKHVATMAQVCILTWVTSRTFKVNTDNDQQLLEWKDHEFSMARSTRTEGRSFAVCSQLVLYYEFWDGNGRHCEIIENS